MEDSQPAGGDGGGGLRGVHPPSGGLTADEADGGIPNKVVKASDGVGTAPHAGQHRVGQAALPLQHLRLDLPGDHRLEIPDDGGKGVGPHAGAQAVVGVLDLGGPGPHGLGHRVLQGGRPGGDGDHLGPQQPHPVDVEGLAAGVLLPHVDHARHPQQGRCGGGGHPVLAGAGLGDEAGFAHLLGQQGLAQDVVDLVGPGVV